MVSYPFLFVAFLFAADCCLLTECLEQTASMPNCSSLDNDINTFCSLLCSCDIKVA